jgi:mono/diheme cytochrome c family protein
MRILLRGLAALVAAIAIVMGLLYLLSNRKLNRTLTVQDAPPAIPTDSASIARGRYLVRAITKCVECHGENLGGKLFIDAGPVGKVWSKNLTGGQGGLRDSLTPAQWTAAIRHGVAPNGRPLMVMPTTSYTVLGDDDLGAIIAYVKTVPPVDYIPPKSFLGPLGWFLYTTGRFPTLTEADLVRHDGPRAAVPAAGPTAEYGRYLTTIGGCTGCHGPTLSGGAIPGMPPGTRPAANLTPEGIGHYTEADFFTALRTGKRPGGAPIDSVMPYRFTREMTDDDIRAVYLFLKTVPRKPFGNR